MGLGGIIEKVGKRFLGTSNEAQVKQYQGLVREVAALEAAMQGKDDAELRELAAEHRRRVRDDSVATSTIRSEAFALVREVADRRLGIWSGITGTDPVGGSVPKIEDGQWGDQLAAVNAARERLAAGEVMDGIDLPAAVYAKVREHHPDSVPPYRMRAHDVQIIGGAVLDEGRIAELKTGEGKTLVAVFATYLNALAGRGVHVITVNDYLAKRDATWNTPVLHFLGLTIGAIQSSMVPQERQAVYAMDVTYGTNNEFGFDYLRDNLKQRKEEQVQTRRDFAVVDEVDSVLIDEARVPLIISGPAQGREEFYRHADQVARQLEIEKDFEVDIKDRQITLTEDGVEKATKLFGVASMYDSEGMHLPHFLDNALKAHHIFVKDKEYMVSGGEVRIIDEFTGRVLAGRRWSEGLHQAVEAKESLSIQPENQTFATITIQNFFRQYNKLAGMTGTAMTEANEFNSIYKLTPVAIPTNKPIIRRDMPDLIYGSEPEKFKAIVDEAEELSAVGQPMLIGTVAVETSERLSEAFKQRGIPHNVLNARQHQREAEVVAKAGHIGAVTIATNMAGRGTDIKLARASFDQILKHWRSRGLAPKRIQAQDGNLDEALVDLWAKRYLGEEEATQWRGSPPAEILAAINKQRYINGWHEMPLPSTLRSGVDVRQLGGLRIIGTERHESRRIDNQLRGRSGRQGDPGSSRFYLSLDDQLMKRFAGPTMSNMMRNMGLKDGVPIESKMVSRAVEKAQKRVEEYNFGIRKHLLEYDEVLNSQRHQVYEQRQKLLEGEDLEAMFFQLYSQAVDDLVQQTAEDGTRGDTLAKRLSAVFAENTSLPAPTAENIPVKDGGDACRDYLMDAVREGFKQRREQFGDEMIDQILRVVLLETIDRRWKDHIDFMDALRRGIGLESYGQKDPKLRFKEEGYRRFDGMWELTRLDVMRMFFRLQVVNNKGGEPQRPGVPGMLEAGGFQPKPREGATRETMRMPPVGENLKKEADLAPAMKPKPDDPCPCGSGELYKNCHGRL